MKESACVGGLLRLYVFLCLYACVSVCVSVWMYCWPACVGTLQCFDVVLRHQNRDPAMVMETVCQTISLVYFDYNFYGRSFKILNSHNTQNKQTHKTKQNKTKQNKTKKYHTSRSQAIMAGPLWSQDVKPMHRLVIAHRHQQSFASKCRNFRIGQRRGVLWSCGSRNTCICKVNKSFFEGQAFLFGAITFLPLPLALSIKLHTMKVHHTVHKHLVCAIILGESHAATCCTYGRSYEPTRNTRNSPGEKFRTTCSCKYSNSTKVQTLVLYSSSGVTVYLIDWLIDWLIGFLFKYSYLHGTVLWW